MPTTDHEDEEVEEMYDKIEKIMDKEKESSNVKRMKKAVDSDFVSVSRIAMPTLKFKKSRRNKN